MTSVRCSARRRPHVAKWVNTRIRSPAAKTDSTISSRRASLPDRPASGRPSSRYAAGWLQICLSAVMAARIAPCLRSPLVASRRRWRRGRRAPPGRARSARPSSCSGRARRSCRAARPRPRARLLVRRNSRIPFRARSAASPSPDIWAMNAGREPTRPGLVKSRIAHRSPSPFSIGVPVSARRVRAGMRRSCWDGFARRVLDRLRLVEHDPCPTYVAASASTSRTAVA